MRIPLALCALLVLVASPAWSDPPAVRTDRGAERRLPLPPAEDSFHFVIFGDRTGGPPEGLEVLARAVNETNLLGPDLVMTVGDLIQGYNREAAWLREMREFKDVMQGLRMPWYPVAGNHDVYWRGPPVPRGHHEASYEKHFGPLWYWFPHKNAAFFVLYSDEGDPETNQKGWRDPRVNRFSPAQLAWLEGALADAKPYDHVFVFLHHPRWLGDHYPGTNWDVVHRLLKDAGNVSAVFGGHIHRQRYDGTRDGIEYFTLATTGGGIPFDLPGTGHLHHVNLVTVRPSGITVATLPVGSVMDPGDMTPERLEEIDRLRRGLVDAVDSTLVFDTKGFGEGTYRLRLENPTTRPVEVDLRVEVRDTAWRFAPEHVHVKLAPGAERVVELAWARRPELAMERFRFPAVVAQVDYLAPSLRVSLPARAIELRWRLEGVTADLFDEAENAALELAGGRVGLGVSARRMRVPDGPLTVEGWIQADAYDGRRAFLAKTEGSEYGLFVTDGRPSFHVYLGNRYVTAQAPKAVLETGRWHHLAGTYDGRQVRLYVDGKQVASTDGTGSRRTNDMPFYVGADPDRAGRPTSAIDGRIDEVRVSKVARYTTSEFPVEHRFAPDADTVLLLHLDQSIGPIAPDHGPDGRHARSHGDVRYVPVER